MVSMASEWLADLGAPRWAGCSQFSLLRKLHSQGFLRQICIFLSLSLWQLWPCHFLRRHQWILFYCPTDKRLLIFNGANLFSNYTLLDYTLQMTKLKASEVFLLCSFLLLIFTINLTSSSQWYPCCFLSAFPSTRKTRLPPLSTASPKVSRNGYNAANSMAMVC